MFWLFEEYYCSKDDLCEIYALQDKKLVTDSFLTKFHDTIFIKVYVDLIILRRHGYFSGIFFCLIWFSYKKGVPLGTRIDLDSNLVSRACACFL